jgi:chemotaxis protein CheD
METYLGPGEFQFASAPSRLRTLLGSCVAVTFRDPARQRGAMCHYLLPSGGPRPNTVVDGRYADEVIPHILEQFHREGTAAADLEVKMFGGGAMFTNLGMGTTMTIGQKNIQAGEWLLKTRGCLIQSADVARCLQRTVVFDVATGHVWVRQGYQVCPVCQHAMGGKCVHACL